MSLFILPFLTVSISYMNNCSLGVAPFCPRFFTVIQSRLHKCAMFKVATAYPDGITLHEKCNLMLVQRSITPCAEINRKMEVSLARIHSKPLTAFGSKKMH